MDADAGGNATALSRARKDPNKVRFIHGAGRPMGQALNDYVTNDHF